MELEPDGPIVKRAPGQRERLPNKRRSENGAFAQNNLNFQMTVGFYPDGRVGEIFLNAEHANSLLDVLAHDAAIAISLALQFGCPLDTLRHAIKRDSSGTAASPIGIALDLVTP
jgi:ribonucleoside-diphosphate reductase alpha chain